MSNNYNHYKLATSYASKRMNIIQKLNDKSLGSSQTEENHIRINSKLKQFSPASVLSQGKIVIPKPQTAPKLSGYVSSNSLRLKRSF